MNKKFGSIFFFAIALLVFFGRSLPGFTASIPLEPSSFINVKGVSFKNGKLFPTAGPYYKDRGFSILTLKDFYFNEGNTITIRLFSNDIFNGSIGVGCANNYLIMNRGYVSLLRGNAIFDRRRSDNYLLPMKKLSGNIALIVKRNKKGRLDFVVQYATHSLKGFYYKRIGSNEPLQLLLSHTNSTVHPFSVNSVTVNTSDLPPAIAANMTPIKQVEKYKYSMRQLHEIEQPLVPDTTDLSIKPKKDEVERLETALLSFEDIKANVSNFQFGNNYLPYAYEWVFKKTKNIKVLNKLIDHAENIYQYRNDNMPPATRFKFSESSLGTKMYQKDPYAKAWPHYQESTINENNEIEIVSGCAAFSALSYFTVTARIIAANQALWTQKYKGKLYKQIMNKLIGYAESTIEYFNEVYLNSSSLVYRYPPGSEYAARTTQGVPYLIFNRYLPFMVNLIALVETYEILHIKPDQVHFIDKVITSNINVFRSVCRYEGKDYLYYPYAASNPNKLEDFGHGSYDNRSLVVLYKSGRYQFTEDMARRIANTFNDKYIKSPGVIMRWPGATGRSLIQHLVYIGGMEGMIWYTHWNKGLKKNIVDYLIKTLNVKDMRVYWEILKLRDGFYDTVGPIWGTQRAQ